MSRGPVVVERDGAVARVWLERPEARNALDQSTLEALEAAFRDLASAFDVRVVVLGGRGKGFCAGADLKDPPGLARMRAAETSARERRWLADLGPRLLDAMDALGAVTIARIHGHAIGGGLVLALACDLRVAADDAVFAIPEVSLGDVFSWRGVAKVHREAGPARARELVLLGARFDAAAAERFGLLNRVVPAAELDATVDALAARLVATPPAALEMALAQLRAWDATLRLADATRLEADLQIGVLGTAFQERGD